MISIIVSSYKQDYFTEFEKNVTQTIGVPFEIIRIHNHNQYSICEAYNMGMAQAKFPILCFAHEDILFHTQNWGKIIQDTFANTEKLGLLGIVGNSYKSWVASSWATPHTLYGVSINIIQSSGKERNTQPTTASYNGNYSLNKAAVLDGCLMFTTLAIANTVKFDQNTFTNFHCYDLDYSLAIGKNGYDVMVTFDVLIEHLSEGNYDPKWFEETKLLQKKWGTYLPYCTNAISKNEISILESLAIKDLYIKRHKYKIPLSYIKSIRKSDKMQQLLTPYHRFKLKIWFLLAPYLKK